MSNASTASLKKDSCLDDDHASTDVYPVHMLDDSSTTRPLTLAWVFRFNDVLDVEKLRDSLTALLEIGDWKKLSGRIQRKPNEQLEIHVPSSFSAQEPAIGFSHNTFDMPIGDHPEGSQLPRATENLSCQADPRDSSNLWPENEPKDLQCFVEERLPQLHLHVTSFADETVVFLRWNHITFDAQGVSDLLKNWSCVLAGHPEDVQPFLGARRDVLEDVAPASTEPKSEPYQQQPCRLGGLRKILFFLRLVWDSYRAGPQEFRAVCLPHQAVERLKSETQLAAVSDEKGTVVGEGDTITAWIAHIVAASQPSAKRPLTVWNAVNCRFRLKSLDTKDGVYPQNMALPMVFTHIPSKVALGPLGNIARLNRQFVRQQSTEEQTLSYLRLTRTYRDMGKPYLPMFGKTNSRPIFFNNLTKLAIMDAIDFSPAVTKQSDQPRSNAVGTPAYHHYYTDVESNPQYLKIPTIVVFGKDKDQNYWMSVAGTPPLWDKLEQEAKRLSGR